MKITLVQTEIEEAIVDYMKKTITLPANKEFHVELTATRGPAGVTAEIQINSVDQEQPKKVVKEVEAPKEEVEVTAEIKEKEKEAEPVEEVTEPVKKPVVEEEAKAEAEESTEEAPKPARKSFFAGFD